MVMIMIMIIILLHYDYYNKFINSLPMIVIVITIILMMK